MFSGDSLLTSLCFRFMKEHGGVQAKEFYISIVSFLFPRAPPLAGLGATWRGGRSVYPANGGAQWTEGRNCDGSGFGSNRRGGNPNHSRSPSGHTRVSSPDRSRESCIVLRDTSARENQWIERSKHVAFDLSACRRRKHKMSVPGIREVFGGTRSSKNAQPHEFLAAVQRTSPFDGVLRTVPQIIVIPTKVGIQIWIPAFAGMTKKDKFPDTNLEEGDLRCHAEEVSIPKGERPLVRELGGFGCELETSR